MHQPSPNAHGSLDAPEDGRLKGWALDPDHAEARVTLTIRIDGKQICELTADQFRTDLRHAGVGDGQHAFFFPIPESFFDGLPHRVDVAIAGTAKALQHSPRTAVFPRPPADPALPPPPLASRVEAPANPRTLPESALNGLSVVIATTGNTAQLERTLRACSSYAHNLPVEFLVAVYAGDVQTPQMLGSLEPSIPNLRSLTVAANSAGPARNAAVAMAARELILFLADDVTPAVPGFFEQHINAHRMLPGRNIAALGKIVWPNLPDDRVSFLMAHLQGAGAQQFGFHSLLPYTWLDWRFFYPENISFKRSLAADWTADGYRADLSAALIEDAELAYRLDRATESGFQILYCPGAAVDHQNSFTVRQFIEKQVAAGMSARRLFELHPGAQEKLGIDRLEKMLRSPEPESSASPDDLLRMIEGAKSWGVVIESNYRLGSQNWHADLLSAIFELSYLQGYILACPAENSNYAAAYRYCLERFQESLSTAAVFEVFGRFPAFTLT